MIRMRRSVQKGDDEGDDEGDDGGDDDNDDDAYDNHDDDEVGAAWGSFTNIIMTMHFLSQSSSMPTHSFMNALSTSVS